MSVGPENNKINGIFVNHVVTVILSIFIGWLGIQWQQLTRDNEENGKEISALKHDVESLDKNLDHDYTALQTQMDRRLSQEQLQDNGTASEQKEIIARQFEHSNAISALKSEVIDLRNQFITGRNERMQADKELSAKLDDLEKRLNIPKP